MAAIEALALDDVVVAGGPPGREVGRATMLGAAAAFFAAGRVAEWRVEEMEVRDLGEVAVCSYRWSERGEHMDAPLTLAGLATDVLVLRDGAWRVQVHHVTIEGPGPA